MPQKINKRELRRDSSVETREKIELSGHQIEKSLFYPRETSKRPLIRSNTKSLRQRN